MNVKGDAVNNWEFFRQQWTDYEVATSLDKQEQKIRLATFRSVMGKECLQIFLNLKLSPEERDDISECIKALESYFKPKRNVVYERYQFNMCTQNLEEPVDSFINRLRKAASTCEFGMLTDELIRDRLVIGLQDHSTKLRLLKEETLDLNKALNICRSSEAASHQLKAMKIDEKKATEEVRVVRERNSRDHKKRDPKKRDPKKRQDQAPMRKEWQCFNCGGKQRHNLENCPAYGHECKACKKPNHFASVCRSAPRRQVKQIAEETDDEQETDSDEFLYQVEEVSSVQAKGKQLFASLEFYDANARYKTKLDCQLDTGATCNVLTHHDLSVISQNGNPALQTSKVTLRLFNGSVMKPLGEVKLNVLKENKQRHELKFQVVEGNSKPLLSAETCETLGLLKINCEPTTLVNTIQETKPLLTKEKVLTDFKDVFEGLGHIGKASFTVDPEVTPVHHAPRRIAVTLHKEVKAKLEELEKKNILVKETEPTDWISSMVVVAKPGKIRICLDPKDLNGAVKRPKYQMPTLEEVLPRLSNAKVFTTLDAKDGFYQISLDETSSKMTTFWTPMGRYRYLRMPFGVCAAPEEFECKLHEHLGDLEGVEVLRDDILVIGSGDTLEEANADHDKNLLQLLKRARKVNLKFNSKKLNLRKPEVKYMGHVLSREGLKPDPDKVQAVSEMPKPTCKQETLSLLGFVNYLAKFLPRLSEIAQPIRELTKKDARFIWSRQHDEAFEQIRQLVTSHPVLKYYDMNAEVTLQCDASEKGLGATLLQNGQPVAFASRTLSQVEQRYAQIEKECLAIVFGCSKFSQYITRRGKITVETDHKPLQPIFKKSLLAAPSRLQRMLLRLQRYNLEVTYKPGSQMYVADHLSRAYLKNQDDQPHDDFQVFALELEEINPLDTVKITSERLAQLQKATEHDPVMQTLKSTILVGWPDTREQVPISIREYWNFREDLTLHNGILFKSQRIIIPRALRTEVISRLHASHLGIEACLRKARDRVYWPAMNSDIKEAVAKCDVCAEYQASNPQQPLQTHKIPDRPWSRLAADLFTLHSKDYIVLVDYYSDFVEVSPLKQTTSSAIIKFMRVQFSRYGIPDILVSDNGPQFASREFAEFAKQWEFQHVTSSPYHPKSNGKAESAVKAVKSLFKKALKDDKDPWLSLLSYRNTPTAEIQSSPVQRLMSRRTKTLVPIATNLLYPEVPEGVPDKIQQKRQKAKSYHDRNVKVLPDLDIGQEVRIAPLHRGKSWEAGTCLQKLSDRSYLVEANGEVLRRNRQAIKPTPEALPASEDDPETALSPPTDSLSSTAGPVPSPPALRSSSRTIKPPVRFQDYVC